VIGYYAGHPERRAAIGAPGEQERVHARLLAAHDPVPGTSGPGQSIVEHERDRVAPASLLLVRTPRQILEESVTIAVVGASRDPDKVAHSVPEQMLRHGWRIIPVNPYTDELWGQRTYPVLAEIPEPVDLVNVFRPSADAAEVVRQAVAIGARAVWLQQGIVSPEARKIADDTGIDYVEDNCIAVARASAGLTRNVTS
jgi:predicted CoA-binding protein